METSKQIHYYKEILDAVCSKSTCDRAKVGAIIVKNRSIISTGYNGSPRGLPHCDDVGHLLKDNHCIRTVHGEMNAILCAVKNGINIEGCDMYTLYEPCSICMRLLINSGIKNCYYFVDKFDESTDYLRENKHCSFIKILPKESKLGDFV